MDMKRGKKKGAGEEGEGGRGRREEVKGGRSRREEGKEEGAGEKR